MASCVKGQAAVDHEQPNDGRFGHGERDGAGEQKFAFDAVLASFRKISCQGFSWVMTAARLGQEVFEVSRVESGPIKRCSKSHRSSRVILTRPDPQEVARPVKSLAFRHVTVVETWTKVFALYVFFIERCSRKPEKRRSSLQRSVEGTKPILQRGPLPKMCMQVGYPLGSLAAALCCSRGVYVFDTYCCTTLMFTPAVLHMFVTL